jgi:hypothetical protein
VIRARNVSYRVNYLIEVIVVQDPLGGVVEERLGEPSVVASYGLGQSAHQNKRNRDPSAS